MALTGLTKIKGSTSKIAATGTDTERKLADRFSDVVNAKDFGVAADGVTDDTEAMQSAINVAVVTGLKLVSYGNMLVDTLSITGRLDWDAEGTSIIPRSINDPMLLNITGDDVTIRKIKTRGNPALDSYNHMILATGTKNFKLIDSKHEDSQGITAVFNGCTGTLVRGAEVLNCGIFNRVTMNTADRRQAFAFTGGGLNNTCKDIEATNVGLDVVSFATGEVNCKALNITTTSNDAGTVYISNADGFEVAGCNISNGIDGGNGIDTTNSKNGHVHHNLVHGCGAAGILVAENSSNVIVDHNTCWNNNLKTTASVHRGGITLYNLTGQTLSDITIDANICYDDNALIADVTQRYALDVAAAGAIQGIVVTQSNNFKGYSSSGSRDDSNVLRQSLNSNVLGSKDLMIYKNFSDTDSTLVCSDTVSGIFEFVVVNSGAYGRLKIAAGSVAILDDTAGSTTTSDSGTGIAVYNDGAGSVLIKNRTGLVRTIQMSMNTTIKGS